MNIPGCAHAAYIPKAAECARPRARFSVLWFRVSCARVLCVSCRLGRVSEEEMKMAMQFREKMAEKMVTHSRAGAHSRAPSLERRSI